MSGVMAAAAVINDRAERQPPQAHTQPPPELEQDAFLLLARDLTESGWELVLAPTKILCRLWRIGRIPES